MIRRSIAILLNAALIGLVVAVVVTAAVGPIAALTGRTPFVIGGGSMSPTIPRGAIVFVEPAAAQPLRAGEVASFRTPEHVVVTHRVVRVVARDDGTWYETKGDANAHPDPALWPASSVVGCVVAYAPGIGFASWLFRQPIGWLNVFALAGWLLVARRMIRAPEPIPREPIESPGRPANPSPHARGETPDAGTLAPRHPA